MIKAIFGWLGRKGALFVALLAAMTIYAVYKTGDVQSYVSKQQNIHLNQAASLDDIVIKLTSYHEKMMQDLSTTGEMANKYSIDKLNEEIDKSKIDYKKLKDQKKNAKSVLLSVIKLDLGAILDDRKRDLDISFLDKKIAGLENIKKQIETRDLSIDQFKRDAEQDGLKFDGGEGGARERWRQAAKACAIANKNVKEFDQQGWISWHLRQDLLGRRGDLVRKRSRDCADFTRRKREHEAWEKYNAAVLKAQKQMTGWVAVDLPLAIDDIKERAEKERQFASETVIAKSKQFWHRYHIDKIIKSAIMVFLGILFMPFLIRLFCYFVLIPIAMRRPAIRLVMPGGSPGELIPKAAASATSVSIRLKGDEELLVRQDYLQVNSNSSRKETQWFLDWRHPITSLATGLTFLTRIRGGNEATTVSAVHDAFAEVTVLTLPEGGNCVLKPRAIAAVVQPIGRSMRVTGHWRLFSLNAWLTSQFRYLVFHGPAQIVLKGGRGIRVERAESGRIFGQDQLVGFSADLAYSVTRVETFWPYFLGREQLLKDKVEAGKGMLIVEEAPMVGRRGSEVRQGIEGMIDAGMKLFGM